MEKSIGLVLQNFTVFLLMAGLMHSGLFLWRSPKNHHLGSIIEALLAYFLLYSVAISYFYNFVIHVFFGEMIAEFIGWADSPFQAEVGFASLGFAMVGILAFRGSFDLRLAAVVGPACFLWGAAVGHIWQIFHASNLAPGNAGTVLYTDILIPVIGFGLLKLQQRYPSRS
ncbi:MULTISPECIES: DUF6790 family protein [unclassified Synechocystis]|uniref:DUF6790 family protein n=1 Tax=unclassified Synechocystis TaxID=2640012 RepID=UPI0003F75838|nr:MULTISPECIES: DUF6790 family protein [unclassified Synechocystis]AIE73970.1 hypothetical protein D082_14420 [Synechocystis sp. PCC 6714]MCT0252533.1 hypothetical protein [Synechocystis sp. CS-94]